MSYQLTENFARFFLEKPEKKNSIILKTDFVNIAIYFGTVQYHQSLGRIDNLENILINKITALTRFEPKDIADVWIISKNKTFNWKQIFRKAREKDRGVSVEEAAGIIKNFPEKYFEKIRWIDPVKKSDFFQDLTRIAKEILTGSDNTVLTQE